MSSNESPGTPSTGQISNRHEAIETWRKSVQAHDEILGLIKPQHEIAVSEGGYRPDVSGLNLNDASSQTIASQPASWRKPVRAFLFNSVRLIQNWTFLYSNLRKAFASIPAVDLRLQAYANPDGREERPMIQRGDFRTVLVESGSIYSRVMRRLNRVDAVENGASETAAS